MPPSSKVPRAPRVIVVDDEAIMLRTVKRVLHRAHPDWEVIAVGSGAEALAVLERMRCDVLVADLIMPDMPGEDLLAKVREGYPCVIRVIHSGELHPEKLHPAEELAHLVLVKPATSGELVETAETAMSLAQIGAARLAAGD